MKEIFPYLFRTKAHRPFAFSSFQVSAYLIVRPHGNLLIYSSKHIDEYYDFINQQGGLAGTLITHEHEASSYCNLVADHYNVPFYCPQIEEESIAKICKVDRTYSGDLQFASDFRIIHTPGHTPGSSCFLWVAPDGRKILFTGDNLFPTENHVWNAFPIDKNDISEIIGSLNKLKDMEVDVIIPAGTADKNYFHKEIANREEWKLICETAIKAIKN